MVPKRGRITALHLLVKYPDIFVVGLVIITGKLVPCYNTSKPAIDLAGNSLLQQLLTAPAGLCQNDVSAWVAPAIFRTTNLVKSHVKRCISARPAAQRISEPPRRFRKKFLFFWARAYPDPCNLCNQKFLCYFFHGTKKKTHPSRN